MPREVEITLNGGLCSPTNFLRRGVPMARADSVGGLICTHTARGCAMGHIIADIV